MSGLWFAIMSTMLIVYVVLDGFDFGAGILHLAVAKTDAERRTVIGAIGPVWDANEVWLISSGALLFFAFPRVYASAFSGFYLPLIVVLWLLVGRGLSIDWRSHHENPLWRAFADFSFTATGCLMAIVLGAALGNLIRGVPVQANGYFWIPLFTWSGTEGGTGVLDGYTVTVAVFTAAVLTGHGAMYLAWKTEGAVRSRALSIGRRAWIAVIALMIAVTIATARRRPDIFTGLAGRPLAWPLIVLIPLGLAGVFLWTSRGRERAAFLSSAAFIVGMLGSTAAGLYPVILRSTVDPAFSLGARNAAAGIHGLRVGVVWWCIAMPAIILYFVHLFRSFRGKIRAEEEAEEGY
jgi:cytochrome bd ubiquinol oxidase subunit II